MKTFAIKTRSTHEFPSKAAQQIYSSDVAKSFGVIPGADRPPARRFQPVSAASRMTDVFVIDDDISVREAVVALLCDEGFFVRAFRSAEECLKEVREICPFCIITDVHLPGLSGLELQEMLNAESEMVPFIFITGYGDIPMSVRAMKSGAIEFLTKPFSEEILSKAVQTAVTLGRHMRFAKYEMKAVQTRYSRLTPREREVLPLIVAGFANKNVGFELGISEITVKAHRGSMMRKMKADSLAALIQMAIKLDLIPKTYD